MPTSNFVAERAAVAAKLDAAIRRSLAVAKIPEVNDRGGYVFGEFAIGTHPSTREMRFFLEDVNAFIPELIARIRDEVLSAYPKWKIVPQFHTQEFTISAKMVKFGEKLVRGEVIAETPAYQEWWRATVALDEENYGPARRMFRLVTSRVRKLLPRVAEERFAFVAAFRKQDEGACVWLLMAPDLNAVFREKYGPVQTFAVTADGVVHPEFCRDFSPLSGREPAAWLKLFDRPKATESRAELGIFKGPKVGTVIIEEYLTDEDLKTRLAGN
jgi:hypothetical protein